ncbi:MAG: hypothetical protein RJQ14_20920 [Marinoscillum sp.]
MKDHKDHRLEQTLRELDRTAPGPDFSKNVMLKVKTNTSLLAKPVSYLKYIPKVLIGCFMMITVIFAIILLPDARHIEFTLPEAIKNFLGLSIIMAFLWSAYVLLGTPLGRNKADG